MPEHSIKRLMKAAQEWTVGTFISYALKKHTVADVEDFGLFLKKAKAKCDSTRTLESYTVREKVPMVVVVVVVYVCVCVCMSVFFFFFFCVLHLCPVVFVIYVSTLSCVHITTPHIYTHVCMHLHIFIYIRALFCVHIVCSLSLSLSSLALFRVAYIACWVALCSPVGQVDAEEDTRTCADPSGEWRTRDSLGRSSGEGVRVAVSCTHFGAAQGHAGKPERVLFVLSGTEEQCSGQQRAGWPRAAGATQVLLLWPWENRHAALFAQIESGRVQQGRHSGWRFTM
jgi:hypothetical protein